MLFLFFPCKGCVGAPSPFRHHLSHSQLAHKRPTCREKTKIKDFPTPCLHKETQSSSRLYKRAPMQIKTGVCPSFFDRPRLYSRPSPHTRTCPAFCFLFCAHALFVSLP